MTIGVLSPYSPSFLSFPLPTWDYPFDRVTMRSKFGHYLQTLEKHCFTQLSIGPRGGSASGRRRGGTSRGLLVPRKAVGDSSAPHSPSPCSVKCCGRDDKEGGIRLRLTPSNAVVGMTRKAANGGGVKRQHVEKGSPLLIAATRKGARGQKEARNAQLHPTDLPSNPQKTFVNSHSRSWNTTSTILI
jgi:hypothetical protein